MHFCLVLWFPAIASIVTQFWQASITCKGHWNIFTCYLTCRCTWRNCRSSEMMCNTARMFSSDQVGCTWISQVVQLLKNKRLFVEVLINAAFVWHHRWYNMGAFHQRVFKMTPIAVLVEFFFTKWIEINEYLNKWKTIKQYALLVSTGWTMLVYQLLCAEREREREEGGWGLICSQLQELAIEYLWLYPFGYFHYASYFT